MSNTYDGIYKGIVVDNDDPDYVYRVVCQVPLVLGDAHSNWCEPITPTVFIPRVGDIVWVQFVDGDPSQPIYQSRPTVNREVMEPGTMTITGDDIADFSLLATKFHNSKHFFSPGPPTLTANSPSGGSIAWSAFSLVYQGQLYSIPAANTALKYTWWPYNGGAGGALVSSNSFPSTLTDDDLLLFLNTNGIPVNVQTASVVPGDLLVPGSVLANALAAHIVTADKMLVGFGSNLIPNAGFENGSAPHVATVAASFTIVNTAGFFHSGQFSLRLVCPTIASGNYNYQVNVGGPRLNPDTAMPVRALDNVYVEGYVRGGTTATSQAALYVDFMDASGTLIGTAAQAATLNPVPSGAINKLSGTVVAPAGAAYAALNIAAANTTAGDTQFWDDMFMGIQVPGSLVVNGTIDTVNLKAGAITTPLLAAGAVSADKMMIGFGQNVVANPSFESGIAPHQTYYGSPGLYTLGFRSGAQSLIMTPPSSVAGAFTYGIVMNGPRLDTTGKAQSVLSGDSFYAEAWVYLQATGNQATMYMDFYDASGTVVYQPHGTILQVGVSGVVAGWNKVSLQVPSTAIPTSAVWMNAAIAWANWNGTQQTLVDDMMLSKQVTGSLVVNGTIDTIHLKATAIDGMTVTGAVLQTAASGNRLVVTDSAGEGRVQIYSGVSGETPGKLAAGLISGTTPYYFLGSGTTPTKSEQAFVQVASGATNASVITLSANSIELGSFGGTVDGSGMDGLFSTVTTSLAITAGGQLHGGGVWDDSLTTTTNAANGNVNATGGRITRSTSLSAFKKRITPLSLEDARALLDLNVVTYYDKSDFDAKIKYEHLTEEEAYAALSVNVGGTAEDVHEKAPQFASYDDLGNLAGIDYERVGMALIPLIREQAEQIRELTEQVESLKRGS